VTAAEQYVAAAYLIVFALVLAYVLIISTKLRRLEQALQDLLAQEATTDEPVLEEPTQRPAPEREQRVAVEAQPQ
jgi:CcmD family protein